MKTVTQTLLTLITCTMLFTACSKDDDTPESISREQMHGKWTVTAMDGKLYVKVGNNPETEAPLMTFWAGKIFYFENENRLSVLENQTEIFDFGPYTLNSNKLTVANGPGTLEVELLENNMMKLSNKQDDYYKMMAFYTGQTEGEIRQMYRVQGDIVFHLSK